MRQLGSLATGLHSLARKIVQRSSRKAAVFARTLKPDLAYTLGVRVEREHLRETLDAVVREVHRTDKCRRITDDSFGVQFIALGVDDATLWRCRPQSTDNLAALLVGASGNHDLCPPFKQARQNRTDSNKPAWEPRIQRNEIGRAIVKNWNISQPWGHYPDTSARCEQFGCEDDLQ